MARPPNAIRPPSAHIAPYLGPVSYLKTPQEFRRVLRELSRRCRLRADDVEIKVKVGFHDGRDRPCSTRWYVTIGGKTRRIVWPHTARNQGISAWLSKHGHRAWFQKQADRVNAAKRARGETIPKAKK